MVFLFIALLIAIIAWLIKYKKAAWLISGYNTASKKKKQEYDIEKLCKYFGNFLFALASLYLFWGIILLILPKYIDFISWCGFISSFIFMIAGVIYLNLGNKLKK